MDLKVLALPLFALLILAEAVITALRGREAYAWRDFGGSMSQLGMNILVKLGTEGLVVALYFFLYQFRLFDIETGALQWLFTLVVLDFFFYWYHRASHRSRFM
jgi:alkylglycerol monooxygenase